MTHATLQTKLNEARTARRAWLDDPIFYGAIVILAVFVIGIPLFENNGPLSQFGYITNAFTELLSIGLTILVLDERARQREARRQHDEDLRRILREMRSPSAEEGARAVDEARERGFLLDGTLTAADLWSAHLAQTDLESAHLAGALLARANLSGALMRYINLQEANIISANLAGANLEGANLSDADLQGSNLADANLRGANLSGADLENVNLANADLSGTDVTGAKLKGASLIDAHIDDAHFDSETVLPDAQEVGFEGGKTLYDRYWTPNADKRRYFDPKHPDFWQPWWVGGERS